MCVCVRIKLGKELTMKDIVAFLDKEESTHVVKLKTESNLTDLVRNWK